MLFMFFETSKLQQDSLNFIHILPSRFNQLHVAVFYFSPDMNNVYLPFKA